MLKNSRIMICVFTLFLIFMHSSKAVAKELKKPVPQDRSTVHIANLLNILGLSQEQLKSILAQSKKAQSINRDYMLKKGKISEKMQEEQLKLSKELDPKKQKISQEARKEIESSNRKLNNLSNDRKKNMAKITDNVMEVLDKKQVNIIDAYMPLTMSPATSPLNDITNISGIIQILEHAKRMPEQTYSGRRFVIAHGLVDKLSSENSSSMKVDRNIAMDKVMKTIDKARKLDEHTFTQQKEELAIAIKNDIIGQTQPLSIDEKLEIFLLNPSTIPILEEKLIKYQDS